MVLTARVPLLGCVVWGPSAKAVPEFLLVLGEEGFFHSWDWGSAGDTVQISGSVILVA